MLEDLSIRMYVPIQWSLHLVMQLINFRLTGNGDNVTEIVPITVTPSLTQYPPREIYPTLQDTVRAKVTANVTMENFSGSNLLLRLFWPGVRCPHALGSC